MNDFTLIPYERKYANAVRACALAAWRHTYKNIFSLEQITTLVGKFYSDESNTMVEELISRQLLRYTLALDQNNNVIGFQSSTINMLKAELTRIYIDPQRIGSGLGKALLKDAEAFFQKEGFKSFLVKVHRHNVLGQRFYERNGFEFLAEDDENHIILKKYLAEARHHSV